jgi:ABC-type multidrug transport system fused ATPase/permease subunit
MIGENIRIIRDFFRLVKGNIFWIIQLFLGSILAHIASLFIPVYASDIIYEITNGNSNLAYMNIIYLLIAYIIYNLSWFWNYVAYSHNFIYSYRRLREKIVNKVFIRINSVYVM